MFSFYKSKLKYSIITVALMLCISATVLTMVFMLNTRGNSDGHNTSKSSIDFVQSFYTEYLLNDIKIDKSHSERLNRIKDKYLTSILKDEIKLTSQANDYNILIAGQDASHYLENMRVQKSDDDGWVDVVFDLYRDINYFQRVLYVKMHVSEYNDIKKIDNLTWTLYDYDNNLIDKYEPRWASKKDLSDKDKKTIQKLKEYHALCYKNGYLPYNFFSKNEIDIEEVEKLIKDLQ